MYISSLVINHDCSIKSERDNLFAFKAQRRSRRCHHCSTHALIKILHFASSSSFIQSHSLSCEFVYIKIKFQLSLKSSSFACEGGIEMDFYDSQKQGVEVYF